MVENYDGKYSIDLIRNGESKNTWTDFHLVPMKRPDIAIAEPDLQRVVLPGTNKVIDIIASPSDKVIFGIRQGTWEFAIDHEQWGSWDEAYRTLAKYINGKRMVIWLDDGTVYGYSGRLRVSGYTPGASWSTITIEYQLDNGRSIMGRIIAKKNISQNGTYNAKNEGAIGYGEVVVDVESIAPTLSALTCTSNGYYSPSSEDEYDGYSSVTVNVPSGGGSGVLESIDIVNNGIYRPTSGVDGYNEVNVFVQAQPKIGQLEISENGIYDVAEIDPTLDGYDFINVWVEGGKTILPSVTLSENTTYIAADNGYDGVAKITVSLSSNLDKSVEIITGTIIEYSNDYLRVLRNDAFAGCRRLSRASFLNCTTIGASTFNFCDSLSSISFPLCTTISHYAFCDCSALSSVYFPQCENIGISAFYSCRGLKSISFPKCGNIENYAFANCVGLTSVFFPICSSIWQNVFAGCTSLIAAIFPECIIINNYAFHDCQKLSSISFPKCVTISDYAFRDCVKLSEIELPQCIKISKAAFVNCHKLQNVSLPNCSTIAEIAFSSCIRLRSLYLPNNYICSLLSEDAFDDTPIGGYTSYTDGNYGSIYVPFELLESYKTAQNWSYFSERFVGLTSEGIEIPQEET